MSQTTINDHLYEVGALNARQQFHLSRKLAPIIPKIVPVFTRLAPILVRLDNIAKGEPEHLSAEEVDKRNQEFMDLIASCSPIADALSAMSDADADYVIDLCLSKVQIQQRLPTGTIWADVMPKPGVLAFDSVDMSVMLRLVITSVSVNLGPFIRGAIGKASSMAPKAT